MTDQQSTPPPSASDVNAKMVQDFLLGLMQVAELVAEIPRQVAIHRANLEAEGFSPTMAEYMAYQYHGGLMATFFSGKPVAKR